MSALITLFAISLASLALMLGFKLAEEKYGRKIFLPEFLYERDEEIERTAVYLAKTCGWWCKHKSLIFAETARLKLGAGAKRLAQRRRPEGALEKNGSASFFMKHLKHKD